MLAARVDRYWYTAGALAEPDHVAKTFDLVNQVAGVEARSGAAAAYDRGKEEPQA